MKTPFKMKGMSFGNSPMKQDSKKTFETIQKMKSKARDFVKNIKIKNISKRNPWALAATMMFGKSASADQPGTGMHGGKKVGSIHDMIKKGN